MSFPRVRVGDLFLLPRIVGVVGMVTVLRRTPVPLAFLVHLLEREPQPAVEPDIERVVRLTQGVLRRTHRREFCYPRAFAIFHVLSGWGCPVTLHFGVRKTAGVLEGHAWVSLDGCPLAEEQDPRTLYHCIYSYSPTLKEISHESKRD